MIGQMLSRGAAGAGAPMSNQIPLPNPVREVPNTDMTWAAQQIALVQQYQALRPRLEDLRNMAPLIRMANELAVQLRLYQRPAEAADIETFMQAHSLEAC